MLLGVAFAMLSCIVKTEKIGFFKQKKTSRSSSRLSSHFDGSPFRGPQIVKDHDLRLGMRRVTIQNLINNTD